MLTQIYQLFFHLHCYIDFCSNIFWNSTKYFIPKIDKNLLSVKQLVRMSISCWGSLADTPNIIYQIFKHETITLHLLIKVKNENVSIFIIFKPQFLDTCTIWRQMCFKFLDFFLSSSVPIRKFTYSQVELKLNPTPEGGGLPKPPPSVNSNCS